jgi:hypothetical protein
MVREHRALAVLVCRVAAVPLCQVVAVQDRRAVVDRTCRGWVRRVPFRPLRETVMRWAARGRVGAREQAPPGTAYRVMAWREEARRDQPCRVSRRGPGLPPLEDTSSRRATPAGAVPARRPISGEAAQAQAIQQHRARREAEDLLPIRNSIMVPILPCTDRQTLILARNLLEEAVPARKRLEELPCRQMAAVLPT